MDVHLNVNGFLGRNHEPAILHPGNRREACFTPQMMVGSTMWTESVEDQPPGAIMCFDQISVACPLKRMGALIAVGQDRVMRAGFERPPGASAACHCLHMSIFCPAFSNHEIIPVVDV